MKKIRMITVLLLVVFCLTALAGCGRGGNGDMESTDGQTGSSADQSTDRSTERTESTTDRTERETDDRTGGVIDDIGDGIGDAVDDLGNAAGDVVDDLTGTDATEGSRGSSVNDENRMR